MEFYYELMHEGYNSEVFMNSVKNTFDTLQSNSAYTLKISLYEMSLLNKSKTRLPFNIWVTVHIKDRLYSMRCMFQVNKNSKLTSEYELIPVEISNTPRLLVNRGSNFELTEKELQSGFNYIKKCRDLLEKFWNQEVDDYDLMLALSKRGMYRLSREIK